MLRAALAWRIPPPPPLAFRARSHTGRRFSFLDKRRQLFKTLAPSTATCTPGADANGPPRCSSHCPAASRRCSPRRYQRPRPTGCFSPALTTGCAPPRARVPPGRVSGRQKREVSRPNTLARTQSMATKIWFRREICDIVSKDFHPNPAAIPVTGPARRRRRRRRGGVRGGPGRRGRGDRWGTARVRVRVNPQPRAAPGGAPTLRAGSWLTDHGDVHDSAVRAHVGEGALVVVLERAQLALDGVGRGVPRERGLGKELGEVLALLPSDLGGGGEDAEVVLDLSEELLEVLLGELGRGVNAREGRPDPLGLEEPRGEAAEAVHVLPEELGVLLEVRVVLARLDQKAPEFGDAELAVLVRVALRRAVGGAQGSRGRGRARDAAGGGGVLLLGRQAAGRGGSPLGRGRRAGATGAPPGTQSRSGKPRLHVRTSLSRKPLTGPQRWL